MLLSGIRNIRKEVDAEHIVNKQEEQQKDGCLLFQGNISCFFLFCDKFLITKICFSLQRLHSSQHTSPMLKTSPNRSQRRQILSYRKEKNHDFMTLMKQTNNAIALTRSRPYNEAIEQQILLIRIIKPSKIRYPAISSVRRPVKTMGNGKEEAPEA